jgi:hypothetical protein
LVAGVRSVGEFSSIIAGMFTSKKTSLIILGITSLVFSRLMFWFFNDPEGPNLLIVVVMAAILYLLSWVVYLFTPSTTGLKRLLLAIFIQIIIVTGLFFVGQKENSSASVTSFTECEAAGYPVGESYPRQCWTPEGKHFVEEIEPNEPVVSNEVTIRGAITCLPKVGTGPQTLECAIGLKGDDGKYYGLRNLFDHDPEYKFSGTNTKVEVSGTLTQEELKGPDGNRYDTAGVIHISSIKER